MASDQHSTPEQRAVLRRKYGGVPPRSCGRCGGQTLTEYANERGVWWRCTYCGESGIADLDSDIVSALDDADALAGGLVEVARYKAALEWYVDPERYVYRPDEQKGRPWLLRPEASVDGGKIARAALAGPAPESPQNAPRMPVGGVSAQETANTGAMPFQRHPDAETPGWGALRDAIDALIDAAWRRGAEIALDPNAAGIYTVAAESVRNCEWRIYNEIRELTKGAADGRTR